LLPVRSLRLEPGQSFAGHLVLRALGKGSMGVVYLAESIEDGQRRALKLLLPEALKDERALERFQRESTASQRIASDRIVKTIAAGVDEGTQTPWLLMEYVEGKLLDEWFEQEPGPSYSDRRAVLDQLFEAVEAVHAAGFVHRDLKPDNIVVGSSGRGPEIKILDLGVAKQLGVSPNNSTAEGLGTPLWTAPEQGNASRGLTPAADVWALGLLAFFLLTGRPYWKGANLARPNLLSLLLEIARDDLAPASVRASDLGLDVMLPPNFDVWFGRCVARDPAARFAEAGEARRYLREVLERRPSTMPPAPMSIRPPPAPAAPVALVAADAPAQRTSPPPAPVRRALARVPMWAVLVAAAVGLALAAAVAWLAQR
jgi:eukaryotic-like serine/threonine-protein kinase